MYAVMEMNAGGIHNKNTAPSSKDVILVAH